MVMPKGPARPRSCAGVRIEQPLMFAAALFQPDLGGLIGTLGFEEEVDGVAGIQALGAERGVVLGQPRGLDGDQRGYCPKAL